ncbi:nucleotidyltransferase domain-containing protein [Neobacillus vireti]|uniref:nucleotidyltransferase domain-containing protein n=1 Tax=Neobacillus vireti TaxID=220686 RepID=UPI002FFF18ED
MQTKIMKELKGLENKYEIKILYAVETGSRAWGFASDDSDYDVRFIYVHREEWYLSIDQKRDVIELPINDKLDLSGWELRKTLQLFRKSNPPLMEWLNSKMVYYQAFSLVDKLKEIEPKVFSSKSALYHYLKMAKKNFLSIPENGEVKIKQYINVLRPILACQWIRNFNSFPPNEFQILIHSLIETGQVKQEIVYLINRKINGDKVILRSNVNAINHFVTEEMARIEEFAERLQEPKEDSTPMLNHLFREVLKEVWDYKILDIL